MGTSVAPNPKNAKLPFRAGTRRRVAPIGQYAIQPGAPLPTIVLPQVGMLSRIYLKIEGTITQSAVGVLAAYGYANLIRNLTLSANIGSASIVQVSGIGLDAVNRWLAPDGLPVENVYGNVAGDNAVSYGVIVPVNANDREQMEFGLLDLQAPELRVSLDITFGALADFVTLATGSNLTLYVSYEYWQIPDPTRYQLPPRTLVRTLEDAAIQIAAVGDITYQIPRLGTLAQLTHVIQIAGEEANIISQVDRLRMVLNKTDTILDYQTRIKSIEEAALYNHGTVSNEGFLVDGTLTWDFFHSAQQALNAGGRDLLNTEEVTTLESIVTINAAVAPGANSKIRPVRRVMQRLV